ncbi:MAG: tryptophan-rich sensory protein [Firmicutes bacterium]|nr:tryptophan-rich sensory protein [Bacillota bacterium]
MKNILRSIFYLFFPLLVGTIVGIVTSPGTEFRLLNKPPLSPPSILFPIVWSILYLLMGISYYIFRKNNNDETISLVYYIQLFINAMWSVIFFLWELRLVAVFWIIILDIFVGLLIYLFYKKEEISSYLNIPYFLWCLFATYLTIGFYILN